jgi:hypothetical protein
VRELESQLLVVLGERAVVAGQLAAVIDMNRLHYVADLRKCVLSVIAP